MSLQPVTWVELADCMASLLGCIQSCPLSRILRETRISTQSHSHTHDNLDLTRKAFTRAIVYGTESGRGNQRHVQLQTEIRNGR